MSFIKQMNLGKQLMTLVGFALAGMILLTVIAWTRIDAVFEDTNFSNQNIIPALGVLNKANDAVTTARVKSWHYVAVTDESRRAKIESSQEEAFVEIKSALETYERDYMTFDTPEQLVQDKALVASVRDGLAKLTEMAHEARALAKQGKNTEAADYLWTNMDKLVGMSKAVSDLRDFNVKIAKESAEHAAEVKQHTIMLMIVIGIIGAVLTLWLGTIITQSIREPVEEALQMAERIAQGQIGNRLHLDDHSDNEVGRLLQALQAMDNKLCEIVGSVSETAESVGSAARQIAQGNDDLSGRTQEQASALEQTAATMEQMTATVKRNSDNAHQADQLGRQARHQADSSAEVVQRAVGAMEEISTASRRIGDIINVIDEIAFQTNLLALNAAVEAARAGEQGRGFAVVATEVRNLAQRSASAAKEIKSLINDSVDKVNSGTELVNASGEALNNIVNDVKKVTDIVAEIASASMEQSSGIDQINHAVTQMDTTTQQNAALVEEAASASKAMEQQASELVERVNFFRINGAVRTSTAARPMAAPARKITPKVATRTTNRSATKMARPAAAAAPAVKRAVGDDHSWSEF